VGRVRGAVKEMGGEVHMGATVTGLRLDRATGRWTIAYEAVGRVRQVGQAGRSSKSIT
jgi:hypothetical protein